MASASANTSRPQPCALDIGVRKKPNPERAPKLMSAIRQPQARMRAGVRQERGALAAITADWLLSAPVLLAVCIARALPSVPLLRPARRPRARPASPRSAG